MFLLKSNRCRLSVPRKYFGFRRKYEQVFLNTLYELLVIATWQVRPADAAVKQHITTNQEIVRFCVKTQVCRRVSWREDQL